VLNGLLLATRFIMQTPKTFLHLQGIGRYTLAVSPVFMRKKDYDRRC